MNTVIKISDKPIQRKLLKTVLKRRQEEIGDAKDWPPLFVIQILEKLLEKGEIEAIETKSALRKKNFGNSEITESEQIVFDISFEGAWEQVSWYVDGSANI